jgi:hypothetical protein
LKNTISGLDARQMQETGVCGSWSTKDLMAHLVEWKMMLLAWYRAGLAGQCPKTPAEDLKWNQLPVLNELIYQKWKDEPLEKVLSEFETTYRETLALANSIPEDQLFLRTLYPWMKTYPSAPLARWIEANTSSHYRWARILIKKWENAKIH